MRSSRFVAAFGPAALAILAAANAGAAPFARPIEIASAPVVLAGGRGEAVAAGAIVGGALGVMLGAAAQPRPVYGPPPVRVIEEEEPVVVIERRRPVRRVVEVEEPAPRIVEEEECTIRRTRIYDPGTGSTVFRKERRCD